MEPSVICSVAILAESAEAQALLQHTRQMLDSFAVPVLERIVRDRSALREIVSELESAGAAVFVASNISTDPLSTAVSEVTSKPVLAVPLEGTGLPALDALRASAREGTTAGTLAIGKAGAINAALLAVAILANANADLRAKLERFRQEQTAKVLAETLR
jgi:5-(carboxyamino)imidazole ribonucleotide mutase